MSKETPLAQKYPYSVDALSGQNCLTHLSCYK